MKLFPQSHYKKGFTIIEVIVVIGVIGILAAIGVVGYGAWQQSIAEASVKSDLQNGASALEGARNFDDAYPSDVNSVFSPSSGITLTGGAASAGFCITATSERIPDMPFYIDQDTVNDGPQEGACELNFEAIAAGFTHTCGIASAKAYCWGFNVGGPLGDGTTDGSSAPVAVDTSGVLANRAVTDISVGIGHSCAVADGAAYCWGTAANDWGQLGNGSTSTSYVPIAVSTSGVLSGRTVTKVSSSSQHSCAVADGLAFCWGQNTYGKLGNGSTSDSQVPVAVSTAGVLAGRTVTDISAGNSHTCAVADGQAFCWGFNFSGSFGNGASGTTSSVPVAVNTSGVLSGRTVERVFSGNGNTCAIADGLAFCWGTNGSGQLGNNSTSMATLPVAVNTSGVLGGKVVTDMANWSSSHTCAIADSQAFCWGANSGGQLGTGTTNASLVPVAVTTAGELSGTEATRIANGSGYGCVVASARAFCWGGDFGGKLGNGGVGSTLLPLKVVEPVLQ